MVSSGGPQTVAHYWAHPAQYLPVCLPITKMAFLLDLLIYFSSGENMAIEFYAMSINR